MRKATYSDKECVVEILSRSFASNPSVNSVVKNDNKKSTRIRALMEYAFLTAMDAGEVFMASDDNGVMLCTYPARKQASRAHFWRRFYLLLRATGGIRRFGKTFMREVYIKRRRPRRDILYGWFMGVLPEVQGKGTGTALLRQLLKKCDQQRLPFYLETSVEQNLPLYRRHGFHIFHESTRFGYRLWFLKREPRIPFVVLPLTR